MQEKKENDGFMSYFSCCSSIRAREEKAKIDDDQKTTEYNRGLTKTLTFMTNISVKSDNSRQRVIAREVAKIGKPKDSTKVFTYQELVSATDNFSSDCMVGEGGFGKVYKGFIKSSNRVVAIKKLDREGRRGSREFLAEVTMLSVVEHENLVNLVGYCMQGDQRILVYDFMPNGSLENHLLDLSQDSKPLDWNSRMRIAAGAAKGLEYLHEVANPPIIFRDFKASNVLLDEHMNPRLSDFGLAKVGPSGESEHVSKRVMGTFGYCAPEYARSGKLTTKSDVYSYGVVLMELISGRRVIDIARPREEQNMIVWAQPLLKEKKNFPFIADPLLEGNYPPKSLHKALAIAAMCLQEDHETRPSIGEVVCAFQYVIS